MSEIIGLGSKRPWLANVLPPENFDLRAADHLPGVSTRIAQDTGARQGHWISGQRGAVTPTLLDPHDGREARALIDELAIDGDMGPSDAERVSAYFKSHAAEINLNDLAAMMDELAGMRAAGLIDQKQFDRMHSTVADALGTSAPVRDLHLAVVQPHPNDAAVGGDVTAERRMLRDVASDGQLTTSGLDRLWRVLDIEPHTQLGVTSMRPSRETVTRLGDELSYMESQGVIDAGQRQRMFGQISQAASLGYMPGVSGHAMLRLIGLTE